MVRICDKAICGVSWFRGCWYSLVHALTNSICLDFPPPFPLIVSLFAPAHAGWLGLYVGDHLWYNLFDEHNVENTANDLGTLIQDNSRDEKLLQRGPSRHLHKQKPDPAA